jgi:hypothetical protein
LQAIILPRESRSRATETPISRRAGSFGRLKSGAAGVHAIALMAVVTAAVSAPARAACITQPNRLAPEGAHWSLHNDRDKNQRCWVLVDASGHDISAPRPQAQPAASSGLSSLQAFIDNITSAASQPQQAQAAPANPPRKPAAPRVAHAGRTEHPAVRPEPKGEPRPVRQELDEPDRDKLFQEFLRWRENQKSTQNPPAPR